jgi:phospholipase C
MQKSWRKFATALRGATALVAVTSIATAPLAPALAQSAGGLGNPTTPIKHVILIIGENRSFDHVFATYTPTAGQTIDNLLSKGIVTAAGTPGPNYNLAAQNSATITNQYQISPAKKTAYAVLPPAMTDGAPSTASNKNPPPFATVGAVKAIESVINDGLPADDYKLLTTGATGLPNDAVDTRTPNATTLPNGPFQLSSATLPYDSYTSSPVHRFYQMWQETDCSVKHATKANPSGCLSDLFPFT